MQGMEQMAEHAAEAAQLLRELGNQNRLMICCTLGDAEMSVSELNAQIPLSQSALSQHLARLREAGYLSTRREGQTVFYRLQATEVLQVILTLKSIFCPDDETAPGREPTS